MKGKKDRIEALKMLISSKEFCSQEDILTELIREGFEVTQATLSRDMKLLKIAKASSMNGKYVYVLPNETMYKRVTRPKTAKQMLQAPGSVSIQYSNNIAVIKTRPGSARAIAYNLDIEILGTIAGDDTIVTILAEGADRGRLERKLMQVIPNLI